MVLFIHTTIQFLNNLRISFILFLIGEFSNSLVMVLVIFQLCLGNGLQKLLWAIFSRPCLSYLQCHYWILIFEYMLEKWSLNKCRWLTLSQNKTSRLSFVQVEEPGEGQEARGSHDHEMIFNVLCNFCYFRSYGFISLILGVFKTFQVKLESCNVMVLYQLGYV